MATALISPYQSENYPIMNGLNPTFGLKMEQFIIDANVTDLKSQVEAKLIATLPSPKSIVQYNNTLKANQKILDSIGGIQIMPNCGNRTVDTQNKIYKQTPKVTNVPGGLSPHNYGLATDINFTVTPTPTLKNPNPKAQCSWADYLPWEFLGEAAKDMGLYWGVRIGFGMVDRPHYQDISVSIASINSMYAEYKALVVKGYSWITVLSIIWESLIS